MAYFWIQYGVKFLIFVIQHLLNKGCGAWIIWVTLVVSHIFPSNKRFRGHNPFLPDGH